ncbi:MAG: hypothetical protein AAF330_03450 [Pseudomonadota bacterium]
MTPTHVTPSEIARIAGITEKHVRRMIGRAVNPGLYDNPDWFGVRMNVIRDDGGPKVTFTSLPEQIREAFVMLDQQELPLPPPPRTTENENDAPFALN